MRSSGTISRYSPWNATSKPSSVTITQRHLPPSRRSTSASVAVPRLACHQRLMRSGVVHALYTRCFGAWNSRVIRISVSVGNVRTALPLLFTATISLPFLDFRQQFVEGFEPLVPRALEVLHPIVDRL